MIMIFGYANGQKKEAELRAEFRFIVDNFKKGNYQADLMTGSENKERRIELINKMQSVIKDNYAWYVDFVKDTPNGLPTRYDERLGLEEEEFQELKRIVDNYRMASELKFKINIEEENSTLKFSSEYESELFRYLEIDIKNQEVRLGGYAFTLTDKPIVSDANNRMGSKWRGYQWTYQEPAKIDFSNIAELVGKDAVLYRINFGILEPSNKLYLSIKGVVIEGGEQKVNFVIPIFMGKEKE